jgi:hypothetical protein
MARYNYLILTTGRVVFTKPPPSTPYAVIDSSTGKIAPAAEQAFDQATGARLPPKTTKWYGPPVATWAVQRAMNAIQAGTESATILPQFEKYGGGNAVAAVVTALAPNVLAAIPGISTVLSVMKIAKSIPVIGDIVSTLGGTVMGALGGVVGGIDVVLGGVMDVVEEIPIVGDVAGTVYDVGSDVVEGVGDFLSSIF